jgi:hypothetical protein
MDKFRCRQTPKNMSAGPDNSCPSNSHSLAKRLPGCCQSNANSSPLDAACPSPGQASGHEQLPLGQGGRAAGLVGLSIDEVAFVSKVVVDVGVN